MNMLWLRNIILRLFLDIKFSTGDYIVTDFLENIIVIHRQCYILSASFPTTQLQKALHLILEPGNFERLEAINLECFFACNSQNGNYTTDRTLALPSSLQVRSRSALAQNQSAQDILQNWPNNVQVSFPEHQLSAPAATDCCTL